MHRRRMEWAGLDEGKAALWYVAERPTWPLDRALRVWLTYEANFAWNPDERGDQAEYDHLYNRVVAALQLRGWS